MDDKWLSSVANSAVFDQQLKALDQYATALRHYYVALIREGFTDAQAMALVREFTNQGKAR
jgi:hypothetical protein